ncbi:hypothetical protein FNV43_RR26681 [Rhamnella rubrinervis]|uniref:RING-type E3 ubiquitin transferase n=1 Tax=Rhamnella rubrinervis TaxID=2594499 RepID=A0A8K0DJ85_9ROSA|nr:hypothetical protein FNV43_RR26681 [Rhamnella rubrinervis]
MGNMQLQSPIISTILYPVLISVFITAIHARNHHPICTSSCGDIQNISDPFRLKTDPPSCGDTDYELSCQNNQTILEFKSGKYLVKKISYGEHIIRLIDINFSNTGSSSTSCNLPSGRIASSSDITSDCRYLRPGRLELKYSFTSFLNCSVNITHPAYTRVPCFGTENNSSSSYHIYAVYEGYLMPDPPQQSCLLLSLAPADYEELKFPSYDRVLELLKSGFDLGWSVMCRDCLLSGFSCTISSWDKPLVYKCGERYAWDSELYWVIDSIGDLIDIALCWRYICASIVIYVFLIHKLCTTRKTVDDNMENDRKVEECTPSSASINNAVVEMSKKNKVVKVKGKEILEVPGGDASLSSPPHTSMEIELHSDSSTEWLIPETMEKDSTKVTQI